MPTRRTLAVAVVALLALTAGCSGAGGGENLSGGDGGAGDAAVEMTQTGAPTKADVEADGGGSGGSSAQIDVSQRQLVYTGQIRLEVRDFDRSSRNLTRAVQRQGGYVSDSRVEINGVENATWKSGRLVLRVPQENFSAMFERARAEGRVVEASTSTEDVTEQVVDLQARLQNLRAERDRLRDLYQRANDTEDVLAIEERLSDVQEEIERTEARLQAIQRQVAYSTITVEMSEPRPDRPFSPPEQWYDVPLLKAFAESVNGVVVVARAAAVTAAYALPYLLAFGVPLVAVAEFLRRRRSGSPGGETEGKPDASADAEDADSDAENADEADVADAEDAPDADAEGAADGDQSAETTEE